MTTISTLAAYGDHDPFAPRSYLQSDVHPKLSNLPPAKRKPKRGDLTTYLTAMEGAAWLCISTSRFKRLVAMGALPKPTILYGVELWFARDLRARVQEIPLRLLQPLRVNPHGKRRAF